MVRGAPYREFSPESTSRFRNLGLANLSPIYSPIHFSVPNSFLEVGNFKPARSNAREG